MLTEEQEEEDKDDRVGVDIRKSFDLVDQPTVEELLPP